MISSIARGWSPVGLVAGGGLELGHIGYSLPVPEQPPYRAYATIVGAFLAGLGAVSGSRRPETGHS